MSSDTTTWTNREQSWTCAFLILSLVSSVLNAGCLVWLWIQARQKWSHSLFTVLQVFLSDAMLMVSSAFLFGWNALEHGWGDGKGRCNVMAFTSVGFCCQSVLSLMLVASERYSIIVKRRKWSIYRLVTYVALTWLFSMSLAAMQFYSAVGAEVSSARFFCVARWYGPSGGFIYGWIAAITLCLGLGVTAAAYLYIWKEVKQSSNDVKAHLSEREQHRLRADVQLSIRMAMLVFVFVICWAPYLYAFLYEVTQKERVSYTFDAVSTFMGYSNSFFNALLYLVMQGKCRIRCITIQTRSSANTDEYPSSLEDDNMRSKPLNQARPRGARSHSPRNVQLPHKLDIHRNYPPLSNNNPTESRPLKIHTVPFSPRSNKLATITTEIVESPTIASGPSRKTPTTHESNQSNVSPHTAKGTLSHMAIGRYDATHGQSTQIAQCAQYAQSTQSTPIPPPLVALIQDDSNYIVQPTELARTNKVVFQYAGQVIEQVTFDEKPIARTVRSRSRTPPASWKVVVQAPTPPIRSLSASRIES